jgi:hypothetical protein
MCQGSCRLSCHAAIGIVAGNACFRSGFKYTTSLRFQLRIFPGQRSGLLALAAS